MIYSLSKYRRGIKCLSHLRGKYGGEMLGKNPDVSKLELHLEKKSIKPIGKKLDSSTTSEKKIHTIHCKSKDSRGLYSNNNYILRSVKSWLATVEIANQRIRGGSIQTIITF